MQVNNVQSTSFGLYKPIQGKPASVAAYVNRLGANGIAELNAMEQRATKELADTKFADLFFEITDDGDRLFKKIVYNLPRLNNKFRIITSPIIVNAPDKFEEAVELTKTKSDQIKELTEALKGFSLVKSE